MRGSKSSSRCVGPLPASGKVAEGKKPSGSDMIQDFSLLASELEQLCGSTKTIPSRQDLRAMNRNDIEKVCSAVGCMCHAALVCSWLIWAE